MDHKIVANIILKNGVSELRTFEVFLRNELEVEGVIPIVERVDTQLREMSPKQIKRACIFYDVGPDNSNYTRIEVDYCNILHAISFKFVHTVKDGITTVLGAK